MNEYFMILISGALIIPLINFVIPFMLYNLVYSGNKAHRNKIIFNWIQFLLGIVLNVISVVDVIKSPPV